MQQSLPSVMTPASTIQGDETDSELSAEDVYLVESILDEITDNDDVTYFLVKWQGYPTEDATWEPKENIIDKDLIAEWRSKKVQSHSMGQKDSSQNDDLKITKKQKKRHTIIDEESVEMIPKKKKKVKQEKETKPKADETKDKSERRNERSERKIDNNGHGSKKKHSLKSNLSQTDLNHQVSASSFKPPSTLNNHTTPSRARSLSITMDINPVQWITKIRQSSNATVGIVSFFDANNEHESKLKEWISRGSATVLVFCPTSLIEEWRIILQSSLLPSRLRLEPPSAASSFSTMEKKWDFVIFVDPALNLVNRPNFDDVLAIKRNFLLIVTKIPISEHEPWVGNLIASKLTIFNAQLLLLKFQSSSTNIAEQEIISPIYSTLLAEKKALSSENQTTASSNASLNQQELTSFQSMVESKEKEINGSQKPFKEFQPLLTTELAEIFSPDDDGQNLFSEQDLQASQSEIQNELFSSQNTATEQQSSSASKPSQANNDMGKVLQKNSLISPQQQGIPTFPQNIKTVVSKTPADAMPIVQTKTQVIPSSSSDILQAHASTESLAKLDAQPTVAIPTGETNSTSSVASMVNPNALMLLSARPANPALVCSTLQTLTFSSTALVDYINRAKQLSNAAKKALLMLINPPEGAWTLSQKQIVPEELSSILFQFISQAQRKQVQGWLFFALQARTETLRAVFIPKESLDDLSLVTICNSLASTTPTIPPLASVGRGLTAPVSRPSNTSIQMTNHVAIQAPQGSQHSSRTWSAASLTSIPGSLPTPLYTELKLPNQTEPLTSNVMQQPTKNSLSFTQQTSLYTQDQIASSQDANQIDSKPSKAASLTASPSDHIFNDEERLQPIHITSLPPVSASVATSTLALTTNNGLRESIATSMRSELFARTTEGVAPTSQMPITMKPHLRADSILQHKCHWIGCSFYTPSWHLLREHMSSHLPLPPPPQYEHDQFNGTTSELPSESLLTLQTRCLATYQQWSLQLLAENDRLKRSIDLLKAQVAFLLARPSNK